MVPSGKRRTLQSTARMDVEERPVRMKKNRCVMHREDLSSLALLEVKRSRQTAMTYRWSPVGIAKNREKTKNKGTN